MGMALATTLMDTIATTKKCPDLSPFRSAHVKDAFNPNELAGFWYEQAYIDVAQVGASCPTLNSTVATDGSGEVSMDFKVKYGPVPFTITEVYTPTAKDAAHAGLYMKNAKGFGPGSKLL